MNPLETLRVALRALLRNKTRSFLTALGIIIGVAAVIAMVAIGEGARASVEEAFNSMGTNLLILLPGSSHSGGVRGGSGTQPTLTWDDLKAIQTQVPSVQYVAPVLSTRAQLASEDQNWSTSVHGTNSDYFDARNWPIALGARFTTSDVEAGSKVVVLGKTVADNLFGVGVSPLGQSIRINNIPFQVIGEAAPKGQSPMGQDYDDEVFIPYTTFQAKIAGSLGKFVNGMVMISAVSPQLSATAEEEVGALLRDRHHLASPDAGSADNDDFSIRNLSEMAAAREQGSQTLSALLASIAAVSLLVGGIGIMNIMLVSVTERTREIGVRMAIGARPKDILAQFLIEALVLSMAGGLVGAGIGVVVASRLAAKFGWPLLLRPDVVVLAMAFSAFVGVAFGLYPARKASRLDPIDALRFE
jgi:putative ABC transport system permease protein